MCVCVCKKIKISPPCMLTLLIPFLTLELHFRTADLTRKGYTS